MRQEGDTNGDHRVDVWVTYENGQRVGQEEDLNFNGKIDARYFFKNGQVVAQEPVAEAEPKTPPRPFSSVQDELRNLGARKSAIAPANKMIGAPAGLETGTDKM